MQLSKGDFKSDWFSKSFPHPKQFPTQEKDWPLDPFLRDMYPDGDRSEQWINNEFRFFFLLLASPSLKDHSPLCMSLDVSRLGRALRS